MKKSVLALGLLACFSGSVQAETFSEKVDKIFHAKDRSNAPGCNVGVVENGKLIYQAGHGLANLELDVKLDGTQVHRMASVSKQFTALAVLLLAEEGKIDLQDDIRKHLPELKDYGHKVTINAMLGHFSGMADYDFISGGDQGEVPEGMNIKNAAGGAFRLGNEDYLTIDEFYGVVKQVNLRHEPNKQATYSNLAYFLLSMLVEKVSGETLREYADKRIFKPLGMYETFFSDKATEIVKNRAYGYRPDKEAGYVTDMTNLFWVGDGGLHSSVPDMVKWDQNFYQPKVGKNPQALLKLFNTPNSEYSFRDGVYANGQMISKKNGRKSFTHGGGWLGVLTFYQRFPDHNFSTILMCNSMDEVPWDYAEKIADIYFAK